MAEPCVCHNMQDHGDSVYGKFINTGIFSLCQQLPQRDQN